MSLKATFVDVMMASDLGDRLKGEEFPISMNPAVLTMVESLKEAGRNVVRSLSEVEG